MEKTPTQTVRIDSYLAHQGVASRRNIASFLTTNHVTVNGIKVLQPGERIDPAVDTILINNASLHIPRLVYYILYKPKGYISSSDDEKGRKTVIDLVTTTERVYPVGRLDKDSTGLMLLTNDGELANKLIHPRFHVPKTYEVLIAGRVPPAKLNQLQNGIKLIDGKTQPAEVKILTQTNRTTMLQITLYEGKKRQIRRMCEAIEIELVDLKRVQFGPLTLGKLQPGNFRLLRRDEVALLKQAVTQNAKPAKKIINSSYTQAR